MKKKELYKLALYLVLNHLNTKLVKFNYNKFTLLSQSVCKCYILNHDDSYVNIKYKSWFRNCGIEHNNVKFYVFIRPRHKNNNKFIYDYEFFIIDTAIIRKLVDVWVKKYSKNCKGYIQSYYKFEYIVLRKNGKILKL